MSEVITLTTGESETIHGTFALAKAYVGMLRFAEPYKTWMAVATTDDDRKGSLALAVRFLNAQAWLDAYDTFAERDAVAAFATAEYELAVMLLADPTLAAAADQGSNIKAVAAGSASVEYFNPTTKNAALLPPVLMRLIGEFLAVSASAGPDGGSGQPGSCVNPFSSCSDLDRGEPF